MRTALFAALLFALGAAASGEEVQGVKRDPHAVDKMLGYYCEEAHGTEGCGAEVVLHQMRENLGLPDAEALVEQGVTLRRAMFHAGQRYGLGYIAITFSRAPRQVPMVEISTPKGMNGEDPQPLRAAISARVWDRVLAASDDFDQLLERETLSRGLPQFCPDAGFVVVEVGDAAHLNQNIVGQDMEPSHVRRDIEIDCGEGMAGKYAYLLAQVALDNLIECSTLERGLRADGRNDTDTLEHCQKLGGDRFAAADAEKFLGQLEANANARLPEGDNFAWRFFADSAENLAAPFRGAVDGGRFYFNAPYAADVDHATVSGQVYWPLPEPGGDGVSYEADLKLQVVRQAGRFVIQSYEISEKRRDP